MKQLLLISCMFAAVTTTTAQCPATSCASTVTITGTATGQNWTGNQCFDGDGAVISNSCNFNAWNIYSFSGMMDIDQTLNIPNNGKVYTSGVIGFANLNMSGNDTMYVDGQLDIISRTANNYPNVIFLAPGATLTIGGTAYSAGDTVFNPGNLSNIITVHECEDEALPIKVSGFRADIKNDAIVLSWHSTENPVLQHSADGKTYTTIYSGFRQEFTMTNYSVKNFFRLYDGTEYSHVLYVTQPQKKTERIYLNVPQYKSFYIQNGVKHAVLR